MNRQLGGKTSGESSEASPLSLLVHAADAQHQRPPGGHNNARKLALDIGGSGSSEQQEAQARFEQGNFEEQMRLAASARAEGAFQQHHALLAQLRAGGLGGFGGGGGGAGNEGDIYSQNASLLAAQQQQQAAALALASDIRTAVAAAQLRQAAQFQNHDFLMARAAMHQQQQQQQQHQHLGLGGGGVGGGNGLDPLQQELELQRLEEIERRQLMAAAAAGGPGGLGVLAARQQLEQLQEAQFREEHLNRHLHQGGETAEAMLQRVGLRGASTADSVISGRGNGESSKDTFQKTPGSVVVPCRARGMPMDHNFKTAYFVIPENVEHGEELICSYFACRNAGIKFRYCTHCKVPVAKRNFRKRHKHGKSTNSNDDDDSNSGGEGPGPQKAKKKAVAEAAAAAIAQSNKEAANKEAARKQAADKEAADKEAADKEIADKEAIKKEAADLLAQQAVQKKEEEMAAAVAAEAKKVVEISTMKEVEEEENEDSDEIIPLRIASESFRKISLERESKWNGLLGKRPPTKDGEAVSAWLMEVLSISDLDTPLGQTKAENGAHDVAAVSSKANGVTSADQQNSATKLYETTTSSVLIKRKRPLPKISKKDSTDEDSPSPLPKQDQSSFAEWKDRKKHKSLPKEGFATSV